MYIPCEAHDKPVELCCVVSASCVQAALLQYMKHGFVLVVFKPLCFCTKHGFVLVAYEPLGSNTKHGLVLVAYEPLGSNTKHGFVLVAHEPLCSAARRVLDHHQRRVHSMWRHPSCCSPAGLHEFIKYKRFIFRISQPHSTPYSKPFPYLTLTLT